MTLDEYIGTVPPSHWRPPTKEQLNSKCHFNNEVIELYGTQASCIDPSKGYLYCDGRCSWGLHCATCGMRRVWSWDICAGRSLICVNPECEMDK